MSQPFHNMPTLSKVFILTLLCWLGLTHAVERGEPEPTPDAQGHIQKKIGHRTADWINRISPFESLQQVQRGAVPPAGATSSSSSVITYHGGPVMTTLSKLVVIWYGNWRQTNNTDTLAGQQLILDALYGMAATPNGTTNYAGITTGYASALGNYTQTGGLSVSNLSSTNIVELTVPTSLTYGGTKLTDKTVLSLVTLAAGNAPDVNAIYLVLSSSDIAETSGFLSKYCGWHSYNATLFKGKSIKYAFVGNPAKSLSSCAYQTTSSPNNNPGVDAMISVIAHELAETVSDPQLSAWFNSAGAENADICGWTYGSQLTRLPNGSYYNVTLPTRTGTRNFLLQRALASSNSKCYVNATGAVQ